eukprot:CAMPEP_0203986128 /NCGR_PEP_ID=MMETSP0360-20130528/5794_1 /ASSEMBLY_ACC=CAM_ASM_000342 /TAXON_ID=268821 /ORGANISM="Scrippsiella Hangoei, Strain SHTV-5" /LENGTH=74 /DNA_ID=CAMNT_0050925509 /DNA_START=60 /DNA_END=282 /DNA_ORIENTATION=-
MPPTDATPPRWGSERAAPELRKQAEQGAGLVRGLNCRPAALRMPQPAGEQVLEDDKLAALASRPDDLLDELLVR